MGHVAWFQEYWILRHLDGRPALHEQFDGIYDAFHVPYKLRWSHGFPSKAETLRYAEGVLDACTRRLSGRTPTREDEYFYELAALHEGMHTENLLGVRQTLGYARPPTLREDTLAPADSEYEPHDVEIPGGAYMLGAEPTTGFVFDNEMWAHPVEVAPFAIASTPVTKAQFSEFVDAGGYSERRYWSGPGWRWRRKQEVEQPFAWVREGGSWSERVFDRVVPLRRWHPMCHVNIHEARAYCRYANRRLPTEAEWEKAAAWNPATGEKRTYPWGDEEPDPARANLDVTRGGTIDVRLLPDGDTSSGCRQMIGNVWEWVDDRLEPYPDFEAGPYAEYSAPYFGKKPVLRGGCFATRSRLISNTYRNFFIRHRRNIFAGFRTCAG